MKLNIDKKKMVKFGLFGAAFGLVKGLILLALTTFALVGLTAYTGTSALDLSTFLPLASAGALGVIILSVITGVVLWLIVGLANIVSQPFIKGFQMKDATIPLFIPFIATFIVLELILGSVSAMGIVIAGVSGLIFIFLTLKILEMVKMQEKFVPAVTN